MYVCMYVCVYVYIHIEKAWERERETERERKREREIERERERERNIYIYTYHKHIYIHNQRKKDLSLPWHRISPLFGVSRALWVGVCLGTFTCGCCLRSSGGCWTTRNGAGRRSDFQKSISALKQSLRSQPWSLSMEP